MYAKVTSLGVTGLAGYIVQVEADLSGGLPQFNLVQDQSQPQFP